MMEYITVMARESFYRTRDYIFVLIDGNVENEKIVTLVFGFCKDMIEYSSFFMYM